MQSKYGQFTNIHRYWGVCARVSMLWIECCQKIEQVTHIFRILILLLCWQEHTCCKPYCCSSSFSRTTSFALRRISIHACCLVWRLCDISSSFSKACFCFFVFIISASCSADIAAILFIASLLSCLALFILSALDAVEFTLTLDFAGDIVSSFSISCSCLCRSGQASCGCAPWRNKSAFLSLKKDVQVMLLYSCPSDQQDVTWGFCPLTCRQVDCSGSQAEDVDDLPENPTNQKPCLC